MKSTQVYAMFQSVVASVELPNELWHADVRIDDETDGYRIRVYRYGRGDLTGPDLRVIRVVPWQRAMLAERADVLGLVLTMIDKAQQDDSDEAPEPGAVLP